MYWRLWREIFTFDMNDYFVMPEFNKTGIDCLRLTEMSEILD